MTSIKKDVPNASGTSVNIKIRVGLFGDYDLLAGYDVDAGGETLEAGAYAYALEVEDYSLSRCIEC